MQPFAPLNLKMFRTLSGRFEVFIDRVESEGTSLRYWAFAFLAIIYCRNMLESALTGRGFDPGMFLVQYALLYATIFLWLAVILRATTRETPARTCKFLVVLFTLILIVPPLDYLHSGPGVRLEYALGNADYLTGDFASYLSRSASFGQKVEGIAFGALILAYVLSKTRSRAKTLLGGILAYLLLFACAAMPSLIYQLSGAIFESPMGVEYDPAGRLTADSRSAFLGYITPQLVLASFLALDALALLLIARSPDTGAYSCICTSVRPVRMLHYLMLGAFGLLLGKAIASSIGCALHDWLFSAYFLLSLGLLYLFASLTNDLFDRDAHLRSGRSRQSYSWMGWCAVAALALSLLMAGFINPYALIVFAALAAVAFIYSAPPLRLKRLPIVSSFALASCALLAVLSGFAVFAGDAAIDLFPPRVALAVLAVYSLGVNYKDLKDAKADSRAGVFTIPVLLGERRGCAVVMALTSVAFLFVPAILGFGELWVPSVAASLLSALMIRANINEKYFRIMLLVYLVFVASAALAHHNSLVDLDAVLRR